MFAFEFPDDIHRNLLHNIVDFLDCWSRALAAFAESGPAIAGCRTQSHHGFQLFAHVRQQREHRARQLAQCCELPLVIRHIAHHHRHVNQEHQRGGGLHELVDGQPCGRAVAALQRTRQIILTGLGDHAQSLGNQGKPHVVGHILEPLACFGELPSGVCEYFAIGGCGQSRFSQHQPLVRRGLRGRSAIPGDRLKEVTDAEHAVTAVGTLCAGRDGEERCINRSRHRFRHIRGRRA